MLQHIHIPPLYWLLTAGAMTILDRALPLLSWQVSWLPLVSSIPVWVGIALIVASGAQLWLRKTAIHPHDEPSVLVTNGTFAISRNPIYLGLALVLIGWALRAQSFTPLLGPPIFVLWIDHHFIKPEEQRLERAFGADFARYCRRVRRWI